MTFDHSVRACVESKLNELSQLYTADFEAMGDRALWDLADSLTTEFVPQDVLHWAKVQTMAATVIIRELLRRFEVTELEG